MTNPRKSRAKQDPPQAVVQAYEKRKLLNDVDMIVAAGLRSGLISYPRDTIIDQDDGKPVTHYHHNQKRPIESYQCLRAYLLRQQGQRMNDIARIIKCATRNLPEILQHGEAIYHKNSATLKESLPTSTETGEHETPINPRA